MDIESQGMPGPEERLNPHADTVIPYSDDGSGATLTAEVSASRVGSDASVYDRIVRLVLYVAALLVPIFFLPWTTGALELNKQMLLLIVAAVGLVVWLLGTVVTGSMVVRWSVLDKGVLAFLAASIVATVVSMTPLKSLFGLSTALSMSLVSIVSLTVLYFLAVNTLHDHGRLLRLFLLISATIALAYGLLQMFAVYIVPLGFTKSRAFVTVGSLNSLGILAAILLPLFFKSAFRIAGKAYLNLAWLGALLSIAILVILNWWVLWVVALTGMLAQTAFDSVLLGRRGIGLKRFIGPIIIIVLGAFLMLVKFNVASRLDLPVEISPSFHLSGDILKGVFKHNYVVGYGAENFSLAFDTFGARELANTTLASYKFFDATSEILNVGIQGGAVGLLAFLFLLLCIVQAIARLRSVMMDDVRMASATSATYASLIAAVVAMFLYPFSLTIMFVFFVLLACSALAQVGARALRLDIEEKPAYSLAASLGFIIGLIAVLTGVYFSATRYAADVAYAKVAEQKDTSAALAKLQTAMNWNGNDDRYYRTASQLALQRVAEELSIKAAPGDTDRTTRIQNLVSSAIQLAQKATQISPKESVTWYNLGSVYEALGSIVDGTQGLAEEAYRQASNLRPGDPTYDNRIGSMYLSRADALRQQAKSGGSGTQQLNQQANELLKKAESAFRAAIAKADNFGLAIYNLGAVYDRQGRIKEAITQIERIAPYNANEPTLMFELGLLYLRDNRKADALQAFQRATYLAPQFANARWYLALLYEDKGDLQAAIDQLTIIQATNRNNVELQQKLDQLRAGVRTIPPAQVVDQQPLQ